MPDAPPHTPHARRLTPPELALARVHIPGFARLGRAEQLRSAAYALQRELGVHSPQLRLAIAPAAQGDDGAQLIAFTTLPQPAGQPPGTDLLAAAQQDHTLYWVGAPAGYVIGHHRALAIETPDDDPHNLPPALTRLLASQPEARTLTLVDPDPALTAEQRAYWQASSGLRITTGALPAGPWVSLQPPAAAQAQAPRQALDRALLVLTLVSFGVLLLAGAHRLQQHSNHATPTAATAARPLTAAEALTRIQYAAPELLPQLQNATYANGVWLLVLPATLGDDPQQLPHLLQRLRANGFAVQYLTEPELRLRISLP